MGLRTGVLRVATVIRGLGWTFVACVAIGGVAGLVFEVERLEGRVAAIRDPQKPLPWERGSYSFEDLVPKSEAQIVALIARERDEAIKDWAKTGLVLLAAAAIGLVIAHALAWVLAGFAPEDRQ